MNDENSTLKRLTDKIHYWTQKQKCIDSWRNAIDRAEEVLENKRIEAKAIVPDLLKERKAIEQSIDELVRRLFPMIPFPEWSDEDE